MRTCYAAVRASLENADMQHPTYGSTPIPLPDDREEQFTLWSFMTHVEWSKSMRRCTKALRKASKPTAAQLGAFLSPALSRSDLDASLHAYNTTP